MLAAQLLQEAHAAVGAAREAVRRGDKAWAVRIAATLHKVEAALEALTQFR